MHLIRTKKMALITLAMVAIVFALNGPSDARAASGGHGGGGHSSGSVGHGFGGGHPSGGFGHRFDGRHFDGHHFDGGRFHHGFRGGFAIGPAYPYYYGYDYAPAYPYEPPTSWWYCSSYGAYYPDVTSCPDAWVPVPAS